MKTILKRNEDGEITITFKDMTLGEVIFLRNAIDVYDVASHNGRDKLNKTTLETSLNNAIHNLK